MQLWSRPITHDLFRVTGEMIQLPKVRTDRGLEQHHCFVDVAMYVVLCYGASRYRHDHHVDSRLRTETGWMSRPQSSEV